MTADVMPRALPPEPPLPPGPPALTVVPGKTEPKPDLGPVFVPSAALTIGALILLVFIAAIAVVGPVRHARDQETGFATLRTDLANATAMVGQVDDDGKPQPLGRPMAVLDIPQIGLREVVREGTTSGVLMSGPGHRRDTPMPGQAGTSILFGRKAAYGGPFAHLDQLVRGQVFSVTTGQGRALYRVIGVRRAGDPQPQALVAGKGRMILITATGDDYVPTGLLRVDADLVSTVQPNAARPVTVADLPTPETALQGDPSAWFSVVLFAQGLLLTALGLVWARARWGRTQVWVAGMPVLLALGVALADQVARLLPNLL